MAEIPAAVLVPLLLGVAEPLAPTGRPREPLQLKGRAGTIEIPRSTELLLTVRTDTVEHHKGQISFPGGVFESGDESLEATALRETEEEIGLSPREVEVVASLPAFPTVVTGFRVSPYVGLVRGSPQFRPNSAEISLLLRVPLSHLLDPACSRVETLHRNGFRVQMRSYFYQSHRIWGVTAMILQNFLEKFLLATKP